MEKAGPDGGKGDSKKAQKRACWPCAQVRRVARGPVSGTSVFFWGPRAKQIRVQNRWP